MKSYYLPVLALVLSIPVTAQTVKTIPVGGNLVAEGIPSLPASTIEDVKPLLVSNK